MELFDLSDFKFISNDHIRFQDGQDVSGHNKDCWRGIRVQNNITGGQGYTVTIYNLEGNHSFWGDNIQMAPKQMKIIENNMSGIHLRGYGTDQLNTTFSDYGLTLNIKNKIIEEVTLHLYDRCIDIIYYKADKIQPQQGQQIFSKSKISDEKIRTPITNLNEILALSQIILESQDLETLRKIYKQKGDYNHPQICLAFGTSFLKMGDKSNAKKALTEGGIYGIQYPCSLYDDTLIDSIGQCLTYLMTQFTIENNENAIKATALAYIYLSRCIEMYPRLAYDSYRTRALLFYDHVMPMDVRNLILENLGIGILIEPFIISDFYISYKANHSPHRSALQNAKIIHEDLEDISISGKAANNYSLNEMVELGEIRHFKLFNNLEIKYRNGEFNLSIEQLRSVNQ